MTDDRRKQQTRKKLEQSLTHLLQNKSFDDITTIELANAAKISRSSFYTHYKDKYEMIEHYQKNVFANVEYIFNKHGLDKEAIILEVFDYLNREDLFAALLSHNGTREIKAFLRNKLQLLLAQDLQYRFSTEKKSDIEELYTSIYLSHAIFGACQTWIARGKKESPEEITSLLLHLLGH